MLSTKEASQIIDEIINEVAGYEATRDAFEHYVMRRFFERFVVSDYETFEFSNSAYVVIKCYDGMLRVEFSASGGVEVKSYIPPAKKDETLEKIAALHGISRDNRSDDEKTDLRRYEKVMVR